MTIHPFGELNPDDLEEYYDGDLELDGKTVSVDLNLTGGSAEPGLLERVANFLKRLPDQLVTNQEFIRADFDGGDTVKEYLEHHLEEIPDLVLPEDAGALSDAERLLQTVHPGRIGIYPQEDDYFAIFDYTIGQELTDYLIVLFVNYNGSMSYMTMES